MNRFARMLAGIALLAGLCHALLRPQAMAAELQPVASIREAAREALAGAGGEVEPRVDERLRLPACTRPLDATVVRNATVQVACAAPAWSLYVPVRVSRRTGVLVLRRAVAAGETLSAADVAVEERDAAGLAGGMPAAPADVEGRIARRPLAAGSMLALRDIAAPRAIRRGDAVALVARAGGFEVRAEGRALGDAAVGERVNVENAGSRRIVQAWARGPGEAEVR